MFLSVLSTTDRRFSDLYIVVLFDEVIVKCFEGCFSKVRQQPTGV